MKLDYIADALLFRLYSFTTVAVGQLHFALVALSNGDVDRVALHEQPWIEMTTCRLTLCRRGWDQWIVPIGDGFECGITQSMWGVLADKAEAFMDGSGGHHWLVGGPEVGADYGLLLSPNGDW